MSREEITEEIARAIWGADNFDSRSYMHARAVMRRFDRLGLVVIEPLHSQAEMISVLLEGVCERGLQI